ncbi:LOG family protein [Paenibacillus oceani]|uniref:Cytokinin riboside 5'-monophosphate phosphoribohydrolase n=1 Tax=Paenibacillus oceani TaxID=2772510 RepID=A0A927C8L4_9BACL|nr:TIGR00730 family Rossman fold protein [Paenibacillus oceani]MBD2862854.1 TIGR00730 family Rossman fold protein [Paenibacillus oceani]
MKRICIFSGSNPGSHSDYELAANELGDALVAHGIDLVYGGASVGLMGRVADKVLSAGGQAIGVMPTGLFRRELAHTSLTEFHEVGTMHERKALMAQLSDAFISLPGGLGTYEELFEAACWSQIGIHAKPIGLLNVRGFFDPLVEMLKHTVREGFMKEENLELLVVEPDPVRLIERLLQYAPVDQGQKWVELTPKG